MYATDQTAGEDFERFLGTVEPRLRVALTAAYGPADGRAAAVDALSWAWEHWSKVRELATRPATSSAWPPVEPTL